LKVIKAFPRTFSSATANFKTKLEARLETDDNETEGEVMVAYSLMLKEGG
jgi:hypothetical protein